MKAVAKKPAMNKTAHPQLLLTKPAFVCLADDTLVFLDLHNDKYSCLERQHTKPIANLLGLPAPSTEELASDDTAPLSDSTDTSSRGVRDIVQNLIDSGLATRDPNEGKPAEFITQKSELREMLGYNIGDSPKIRPGHLFNFFRSLIVTKSLLRFASMEHIVTRVRRRRKRNHARGRAEPNTERINELVEIYKILKPLFVTVKDECLFNSLFLIEFLACYRVYPNWYFGVRLNEFYAHCWVQKGDVIYDDFIQSTCQNQPIMAV
ncbi:MAG: lasso peptide biosynthesis B2 protein [Pseudomonadota bacterium]